MVSGSQFEAYTVTPPIQGEVWVAFPGDDELYYKGSCFRYNGYIITASHVIENAARVIIIGAGKERGQVDIDVERFVELPEDITWFRPTANELQKLAMKSAKLATTVSQTVVARLAALSQSSFGLLKEFSAMGFLQYNGSTKKGFSGCPYFINKTVYGMHLGAIKEANVGYSSSYIMMLIRASEKKAVEVQEDSAEYLMGQLDRYQDSPFLYEPSPMDPDEIRVKIGGMYHVVDSDTFSRLNDRRRGRRENQRVADWMSEEAASDHVAFLGQRHPEEAKDLPLAPRTLVKDAATLPTLQRGAAMFQAERLDTVPVSRPPVVGPRPDPVSVRRSDAMIQTELQPESRSPTTNSGFASHVSTPAQQSVVLTTTTAATNVQNRGTRADAARRKKAARAQRIRNLLLEVEELRREVRSAVGSQRPSSASRPGAAISHVQPMPTAGLTASSSSP